MLYLWTGAALGQLVKDKGVSELMNLTSDKGRKKVLIITYCFPPAGGVGTFRVTKFVKYLREFSWEPLVITVREDCYPKDVWLDHSLEKDIPHSIRTYRTKVWHSRIINDKGILWLPPLLLAVVKAIKEEHPDLVYLTGGPFFPLIVGPIVKLLVRLPYVVDLRDPWKLAQRANPPQGFKARVGQLLTNVAEPIVIRYAARVVCATRILQKEYQVAYTKQSAKFITITNGYDPDDFAAVAPVRFMTFTIVYTGKFRVAEAFRDPTAFFLALKRLLERGFEVRFVHVGRKEKEVMDLAEQAGVQKLVEFVGPKPYHEALGYAKGADVLLLIGGGQRTEQTGKIFDYIGCKKHVMALADINSGIAEIAREIPWIKLLENGDPQAIATAIEELYYNQSLPKTEPDSGCYQKYHRKYLTRLLAKIFDQLVPHEEKV